MSVFDLALLYEAECWDHINRTLEQFPILRGVYDQAFLERLIPKKRNLDNYLLLLLTSPDSEFAQTFWSLIVRDLETLADEDALKHFSDKLRWEERPKVEGMRTELALPAWLKRTGVNVRLEPPLEGRNRNPDFTAATTPTTWWEIKTLSDLDFLTAEERIQRDIQNRLRRINEPYVLHLRRSEVQLADVSRAVREIKRLIAEFHKDGGTPPVVFKALGLEIEVSARTKNLPFGYLGSMLSRPRCFTTENMKRVLNRVCSAVGQLPPGGAGIVVVDRTPSEWVELHDVVDACFGEERAAVVHGLGFINVRRWDGVFSPRFNTRISAVAYYSRAFLDHEENEFEMQIIHNSFAAVPIPPQLLRGAGVTELRCIDAGGGKYAFEEG